ncbi:hypothetical protein CF319_g9138 [Tilletia indica]|nr:hypothetical protein CF319_g9138 [Tilletia indica]
MCPKRLPAELWFQIVGHVLTDTPANNPPSQPQLSLIQQAKQLAMVDNTFQTAVDEFHHRSFHTFNPDSEPTVLGALQPWIPRHDCPMAEHMLFWQEHFGTSWPGTTDLEEQISEFDERKPYRVRSVRVDIRVPGFSRANNCMSWTQSNFHTWILSGAMLCRIAQPNPRLRVLHLRLSAHADFYPIVEGLIASNPRLTDIVIEDDSHPDLDGLRRPVLDLDSLCDESIEDTYQELERFIIRAPALQVNAVECGSFLRRTRSVDTFCLAVHNFVTRQPTWLWVLELLRNASYVERFEVSTSMSSDADQRTPRSSITPVKLSNLKHLVLDITEVDVRLLHRLHAPLLKHMCIRSLFPVASHGELSYNHFPRLLCVTIWCPGGAIERFRALGLRKRQYIHNITNKRLLDDADEPILIYILKLDDTLSLPEDVKVERPCKRMREDEAGLSTDSARPHTV